jgi:hypothetical protein
MTQEGLGFGDDSIQADGTQAPPPSVDGSLPPGSIELPNGGYMVWVEHVGQYAVYVSQDNTFGPPSIRFSGWRNAADVEEEATGPGTPGGATQQTAEALLADGGVQDGLGRIIYKGRLYLEQGNSGLYKDTTGAPGADKGPTTRLGSQTRDLVLPGTANGGDAGDPGTGSASELHPEFAPLFESSRQNIIGGGRPGFGGAGSAAADFVGLGQRAVEEARSGYNPIRSSSFTDQEGMMKGLGFAFATNDPIKNTQLIQNATADRARLFAENPSLSPADIQGILKIQNQKALTAPPPTDILPPNAHGGTINVTPESVGQTLQTMAHGGTVKTGRGEFAAGDVHNAESDGNQSSDGSGFSQGQFGAQLSGFQRQQALEQFGSFNPEKSYQEYLNYIQSGGPQHSYNVGGGASQGLASHLNFQETGNSLPILGTQNSSTPGFGEGPGRNTAQASSGGGGGGGAGPMPLPSPSDPRQPRGSFAPGYVPPAQGSALARRDAFIEANKPPPAEAVAPVAPITQPPVAPSLQQSSFNWLGGPPAPVAPDPTQFAYQTGNLAYNPGFAQGGSITTNGQATVIDDRTGQPIATVGEPNPMTGQPQPEQLQVTPLTPNPVAPDGSTAPQGPQPAPGQAANPVTPSAFGILMAQLLGKSKTRRRAAS